MNGGDKLATGRGRSMFHDSYCFLGRLCALSIIKSDITLKCASNTVCYECVLPIIKTNMAPTSFYGEAEINEGRNQNNQNVDTLDKMSF